MENKTRKMNLIPQTASEFSKEDYWNQFFRTRNQSAFEWYGDYIELSCYFNKYVKEQDVILFVGCGNSTLSASIYDDGMKNCTCIDISEVVIDQMTKKHAMQRTRLKYLKMDVLNMTFDENSFSVIVDKGTLDALMAEDSLETREKINRMFESFAKVLRVGGRYICISLLQDYILETLMQWFAGRGWMIRIHRCFEAEGHSNLPVFMVICTKLRQSLPKPMIELALEIEFEIERSEDIAQVLSTIKSVQQFAIVQQRLNSSKLSEEIPLHLHLKDNAEPRYTLHVVDQNRPAETKFGIFIVPQGRECEWLFSSVPGRKQLAISAGCKRLVVVHLNRHHQYKDLDEVKAELSEKIMILAPKWHKVSQMIPFLSIGEDVGQRTIINSGESAISGKFVIEDVLGDNNQPFRHLVFLNNPNVVQSEAKLKQIKRKGKSKTVIDHNYLACQHHTNLISGLSFLGANEKNLNVLVIGLGGGSLVSFMARNIPKICVTAVELDPAMVEIAKKWFDLHTSEKLIVTVGDGIEFINQSAVDGKIYDAIMVDADSKDLSIGMSCPPAAFLEKEFLNTVKSILDSQGIFMVNFVCRDQELKTSSYEKLKDVFSSVVYAAIPEEVNEVFYASNAELSLKNCEITENEIMQIIQHENINLKEFSENLKIVDKKL